jgi:hypothetical protein
MSELQATNSNSLKVNVRVIFSVKHNIYIVINTQLATCSGSSEPSLGQFLVYAHGAFSECAHYAIPYFLQFIFILNFN